ncbi:MAG: crossover junction endodeoxyribonuclease RuvC [Planctomycetales bacterium]
MKVIVEDRPSGTLLEEGLMSENLSPDTAGPLRFLGIDQDQSDRLCPAGAGKRPRVLEEVIRSTTSKGLAERVAEIGSGIREIIEQYHPRAVAVEKVFSTPKYPKSAIVMSHAGARFCS